MTAPFAADITATVVHRIAAGVALKPFEDFTEVADRIMNDQYKFLGTFLARSAAGIDTALWDLEAKRNGVSVAAMVGQKLDYIDLYASSMKRDLPVQEEADRLRALQDKFGYRALKLHPGIPVSKNKDYWPGRTPIAGGEQDYLEPSWRRIIDEQIVDICQPDLLYIGGFTRSLRIAERAAKLGRPVTAHTSNQSPIFVMGLHYHACIETPYAFLECGIEDDQWTKCYTPAIEIKDGRAKVPDSPGWGFEPTEEFISSSRYAVTKAR